MRKVLMLGVSLVLALQGLAQASVLVPPCPIQKSEHQDAARGANFAHGCCNDADAYTKTGKPCKMGEVCPVANAWLTSSQRSWAPLRVTVPAVSSPEPFALRIDPSGRWRPPALS